MAPMKLSDGGTIHDIIGDQPGKSVVIILRLGMAWKNKTIPMLIDINQRYRQAEIFINVDPHPDAEDVKRSMAYVRAVKLESKGKVVILVLHHDNYENRSQKGIEYYADVILVSETPDDEMIAVKNWLNLPKEKTDGPQDEG